MESKFIKKNPKILVGNLVQFCMIAFQKLK